MIKRVNVHLNNYEYIAVILSFVCIGVSVMMRLSYNDFPIILKYGISILEMFSELIVITIEVFLFILLKKRDFTRPCGSGKNIKIVVEDNSQARIK